MYRASETGILSEEDLAVARRESSEAEYAQEYECSFTAAVVGAYYGKLEANDLASGDEATNLNFVLAHEYDLSKRTIIYSGIGYKQIDYDYDNAPSEKETAAQVIMGLRHIF